MVRRRYPTLPRGLPASPTHSGTKQAAANPFYPTTCLLFAHVAHTIASTPTDNRRVVEDAYITERKRHAAGCLSTPFCRRGDVLSGVGAVRVARRVLDDMSPPFLMCTHTHHTTTLRVIVFLADLTCLPSCLLASASAVLFSLPASLLASCPGRSCLGGLGPCVGSASSRAEPRRCHLFTVNARTRQ